LSIQKSLINFGDDLVKSTVQQHGYKRVKRGYRSLEDLKKQFPAYEPPKDPYFKHQWYLVSNSSNWNSFFNLSNTKSQFIILFQ
jgi:hypothetical protein